MTLSEYLSAPPCFPASENQVGIVEHETYLSLLYRKNSLHGIGQWRQKTVQDRTSLLR